MQTRRTVILVIIDGWGVGRKDFSNPIHTVNPKTFDFLKHNFPSGTLQASGISVGLPWGEEGNSEVGHLNMGAGKVVYQNYPKITLAIRDKVFFTNPVLKAAFDHAITNNSSVNIIGLLGEANVHSSFEHLEALLKYADQIQFPKERVQLHLISDGRDSPPQSAIHLLSRLPYPEQLASIGGRYYGMDRDNHWDRIQPFYTAITESGNLVTDLTAYTQQFYAKGLNDEYIAPTLVGQTARPVHNNDAVIFFNFREDRMKQIVKAFTDTTFTAFPVKHFSNLYCCSFIEYDPTYAIPVLFPPEELGNPLGKVLADNNKSQWRTAETEKYAHITYFFNGLREAPFEGEYRVLIPSRQEFKPAEHPEMRAEEITTRLVEAIEERAYDFILTNYANADIIAHTGNMDASIKAVEIVDAMINRVVTATLASDSILIITSDHGNMERLVNPLTGEAETKHDANPVPIYLVANEYKRERSDDEVRSSEQAAIGILADVAPTILQLMHIPQPKEMTAQSLVDLMVD
ncbi:MAG: 2,3-bisphosphoglycerate-independent phosphoglycerate mutase [Candidatus Wolfebacteria bacterium GW2011_GWC2_39_22]|uniref:2,3-bisphosphoglycerate-independent phosphoglycerate mutase n=2 Tax=Candidatus Wolfeibacteriota TaxID=1752735 RepID=A0A0G1H7C6_9BACT|nr:MAG: 2,3-bisphosphoglycerate-independent phosphoglycerate mutase [Candidatus Wolfebacteria bacterium GW2011_GWC2_39_22]KKT43281.1 MAG: 2,3-bisphosphoglycerate-independent phosphoglycerate mutase [Candidatus Wolfebacteria bacterium GW2011_GWE2_44_13]HBI25999.1 2,3-bisphosphoglycerate-independent phosphoglycerate mutase [Candidatus Wolfebacteria bacterium]